MEQKIFERLNNSNVKFAYDKDNQKLVAVQPVSTIYYIEGGETETMCILGGDSEIQRICSIDSTYYCSEAAFKSGAPLDREQAVIKETLKDIMQHVFRAYMVQQDEIGPFVWVYENGQATKWRIEEHTRKVIVDYANNNKCTMDCDTPEIYHNADEVYMYNDYILQDKAGECVVREGVYRRLFLTDEQNALVDKLQEAIDECIKGGISIDFDYADNSVTCFNIKNIKEFGYCPSVDEETEESYPLDLSRAGRCLKRIGDYNTEDGDMAFVIKKSMKK
jgi:hypothetical protein